MESVDNRHVERKMFDLASCDVAKVAMMLLVIIYHCICLWSGKAWFIVEPASESSILSFLCAWFGTIHIYVFVFVSGYLFRYLRYEKGKYKIPKKDIPHRAARLLLPYAIGILWAIPFFVYFWHPGIGEVLKNYLLMTSPNQLWFLGMLFALFCIFYCLADFFESKSPVIGLLVCVLIWGVGQIGYRFLPNVFQLLCAMEYFVYYYLGFIFRKYSFKWLYRIPWLCYFALNLTLFCVYYFLLAGSEMLILKLIALCMRPLICVSGIAMIVIGIGKLNTGKLERTVCFRFLKKHNFTMYIFHQQLIYVSIALLNPYASTPLLVLANLLISLIGSALISVGISKIPYVKNVFGYQ